MKAIMVMFDTLRRTMMPCFQPEDQKVPMPNFQRLISHSAVFDHHDLPIETLYVRQGFDEHRRLVHNSRLQFHFHPPHYER